MTKDTISYGIVEYCGGCCTVRASSHLAKPGPTILHCPVRIKNKLHRVCKAMYDRIRVFYPDLVGSEIEHVINEKYCIVHRVVSGV
jgi:hypothetical protein